MATKTAIATLIVPILIWSCTRPVTNDIHPDPEEENRGVLDNVVAEEIEHDRVVEEASLPPDNTSRLPLQSNYERTGAEMIDWFNQIGDVRGTTKDDPRLTFIVSPHIGYQSGSDATRQEIILRKTDLRNTIAAYFSSRSVRELEGSANRERVNRELREQINGIMTNRVQDVAFSRYEFIEF